MPGPTIGEFELAVLMCVSRLGGDAYGLRIRREVSTLRDHDYSVGAIYTTLRRLEDKKLVESWLSDPLPIRGGRSRRHFRVTAPGRKALRDARKLATRLWSAFDLGVNPT